MPKADVLNLLCSVGGQIISKTGQRTWSKGGNLTITPQLNANEILERAIEANHLALQAMSNWKHTRQKAIQGLKIIASECNGIHKACNVTSLIGSAVGFFGRVCAPVTGGLSLMLTGATVGLSVGSSMYESKEMIAKCQLAKHFLADDEKATKNLLSKIDSLKECLEFFSSSKDVLEFIQLLQGISIFLDVVRAMITAVCACIASAGLGTAVAVSNSKTQAKATGRKVLKDTTKKGSAKFSKVLGAAGTALSVYEAYQTSTDIWKGSQSGAGETMSQWANTLRDQYNDVCKIEDVVKVKLQDFKAVKLQYRLHCVNYRLDY